MLKEKIKKLFEPETTTLEKYKMVFTTVDGKEHEFNRINYADSSAIWCSVGDFYLMCLDDYLKDDDGTFYPIKNVVSINFILVDTLNNVIKRGKDIAQVFYPRNEIKIKESKV